ncbi:hypothetical protein, partial [Actinomadura sp. BRA 177]|uniref:hypothetical protein n=1 Tax=Actinomadura sp. BRA 177 TaxID=2745202 RepID=UPI001C3D003E
MRTLRGRRTARAGAHACTSRRRRKAASKPVVYRLAAAHTYHHRLLWWQYDTRRIATSYVPATRTHT